MINVSRLYFDKQGISDALRYPEKRDVKPIVVYNCTPRCNLRCIHCYSSSDRSGHAAQLTTEQARRLIDQIADFGCPVLLFSGGEPLLREDLFELMAYARDKGLRTVLSTNGTLLTDETAHMLAELNLSYAGISLDGPEKIHNRFRATDGAFGATMAGIGNCIKHGIRTGLRFTMTGQNVDQIPEIFRIAAENGIRRICFYHLIRTGRAEGLSECMPTPEQTRAAVDTIIDLTGQAIRQEKLEEVLTVGNHADGPYLLMRMQHENHPNFDGTSELLRRATGNRIGQNIASINWDGQVFPDQFWRNYTLGNVTQTPFGVIWQNENDPVMNILRHKDEYKDPKCARCKWFVYCKGNFRSLSGKPDLADWRNEPPCYLTEEEIR
jgi:radical SAM protein with 4Fe4S-binding SPASM domain